MKVILLDEVKGKGHEGDVVDVARGYAVNFLIPNKLAVQATSGNLKQLELRRANIAKREASRRNDAEAMAAAIGGKVVVVAARAGDEGRLFGSVTGPMIEDAILGQLDIEIDRRRIDVAGHIKTLGDHEVSVRLYTDVRADVTVRVVPEGTSIADALAAAPIEPVAEPVEEPVAEAEVAEEVADDVAEAEDAAEAEAEIAAEVASDEE